MKYQRGIGILGCIGIMVMMSVGIFGRGPSTPEERAKALKLIRGLEENPIPSDAKEIRAWVINWLTEIPDITVKACTGPLDPLLKEKKELPYGPEIYFQSLLSSAAFIIENPDKAKDDAAIIEAGLRGSLKVYQQCLKIDPKARRSFLDDLVQKMEKDDLKEISKKAAANCK